MKRRLLILLGSLIGLLGLLATIWGFVLYLQVRLTAEAILNNSPNELAVRVPRLTMLWQPAHFVCRSLPTNEVTKQIRAVDEVVTLLPEIIGISGERSYIVLLENNMELRPTGGFLGSYAVLHFQRGGLTSLDVQDIYVPDGQIKGYVEEPAPLSAYLFNDGRPGWRLRDANWHPDFVESAKALEWFFREGGIDEVDGFGAVTLSPLLTLLAETGGVQLTDYGNIMVTRDNFYNLAQTHAEVDFFPGSTQKRDFLKSVSTQLLHTVMTDSSKVPAVLTTIAGALIHKEFMFYTPALSSGYWHALGWDGSIRSTSGADFLFINEANLGVNKANCCIARTLADDLSFANGLMNHSLTLTYRNDNPPQPQPPLMWGGGYKNYLRIIVPLNSKLTLASVDDQQIDLDTVDVEKFATSQAYGFLVEVAGNETATVKVNYQSGYRPNDSHYSLLFQKQAGVAVWPSTFRLINTNKTISTAINQDKWITFGLQ